LFCTNFEINAIDAKADSNNTVVTQKDINVGIFSHSLMTKYLVICGSMLKNMLLQSRSLDVGELETKRNSHKPQPKTLTHKRIAL